MRWRRGLSAALIASAVLAALAVPTTGPSADARPVTRVEAEQLLRSATVRLVALGCGLTTESGSGVLLGDGTVVTSRHVVDGALAVSLAGEDGPTTAATARVSPLADVARVQSTRAPGRRLRLADRDPDPGATVTVAGYADGVLVIDQGRVLAYAAGPPLGQPDPLMEVVPGPRPGMSGGPVLDDAGNLAGLVFARETVAGTGLVIPASTLRRTLGRGPLVVPESCHR